MDTEASTEEVRCFCKSRCLLLVIKSDASGKRFAHLKVYKQKRVYAEVVVASGQVRVKCRSCDRWHKVSIRDEATSTKPEELPARFNV